MGDPITDRMREKYEAEIARLREERDTARKQREGQRLRAILAEKYAESAEARLKTATDALRDIHDAAKDNYHAMMVDHATAPESMVREIVRVVRDEGLEDIIRDAANALREVEK